MRVDESKDVVAMEASRPDKDGSQAAVGFGPTCGAALYRDV